VAFVINIGCLPFVSGNSYNSEERIVCSGYDNGDIKMFDLKTMSLRWETNVKNGVSLLKSLNIPALIWFSMA